MTIEERLAQLLGSGAPDRISEVTALGTGLADGYDFYDSAVGQVVVTFNPAGVSSLTLADGEYENYFQARFRRPLLRAAAPLEWADLIPERIEAGSPGKLPVDLRSVTPFQGEVLRTAATIPRGEVRPYGWLAKQVGHPKAARAVGSTMAKNPIPLIIPCHRVVRSDGQIGAYSLGGPEQKWQLLTHEGAGPETLEVLAEDHIRVQGSTASRIFCLPTCGEIRKATQQHVVGFSSVASALEAGFTPCSRCRPV